MRKISITYHPKFLLHNKVGHPECKERLEYILEILAKKQLFSKIDMITPLGAKETDIMLIHNEEYLKDLKKMIASGVKNFDADTYLTSNSYDVALLSVGAAITAVEDVMKNQRVCFSLGRPPGHHAEAENGMGFCLFNNIAIAAKSALKKFQLKRILILDFDVHHGNGTQNAFYNDNSVLFVSIHQSPAYPGTGHANEEGEGKGLGYNLNIPLSPNSGDKEYEEVFQKIIMPAVANYQPELILVSAGFDAYYQDPLANMNLTENGFKMMGEYLKQMADKYCDGKIVFCLEGGYHLEGQAKAFAATVSVFMDKGGCKK